MSSESRQQADRPLVEGEPRTSVGKPRQPAGDAAPKEAGRQESPVTEQLQSLGRLTGWTERRGQLRGAVLIAVTAVVFVLLFRRIDLAAVGHSLVTIPAHAWLAAVLLTCSFPVFSALRWRLTLRAIGHEVPLARCLTIILGVSPISAVAPSKAGDLLKAISFRGEIGIPEVGGTVIAERTLDVIGLALFALVGGLALGQGVIVRSSALIIAVGLIGLLLLPTLVASVNKPMLHEKLERAVRVLHALRARPGLALGIFALTEVNWLASIVQTHLLLLAVGAHPPFLLTTAALPVAIFVGLIPITIGGMGTRDAALVTLLAPVVSSPHALTVALLYSFFGYWLLAILGLPFLNAALFPRTIRRA